MIQSFIPIQETADNPVANETAALVYIAITGGMGMLFCFLSYFFEYKFEGIVGHHYPKSLSVSFDSRAQSYILERSFVADKSGYLGGNDITNMQIEELRLPMTQEGINEL